MIFGRVKSLEAILATAEQKGLHRSLGAFQLTMLGIGAVIGTGIFVLTAEAAQKAAGGLDKVVQDNLPKFGQDSIGRVAPGAQ